MIAPFRVKLGQAQPKPRRASPADAGLAAQSPAGLARTEVLELASESRLGLATDLCGAPERFGDEYRADFASWLKHPIEVSIFGIRWLGYLPFIDRERVVGWLGTVCDTSASRRPAERSSRVPLPATRGGAPPVLASTREGVPVMGAFESGQTFLAGVLSKLPTEQQAQARAIFEAAEAKDAVVLLGDGALARSDYSRSMDQIREQERALNEYYTRLDGWYAENKAALDGAVRPSGDPAPVERPAGPAAGGNMAPTLTQDDIRRIANDARRTLSVHSMEPATPNDLLHVTNCCHCCPCQRTGCVVQDGSPRRPTLARCPGSETVRIASAWPAAVFYHPSIGREVRASHVR
jgi:sulfur transfer complex TusBCD TusB component (DsrH family)